MEEAGSSVIRLGLGLKWLTGRGNNHESLVVAETTYFAKYIRGTDLNVFYNSDSWLMVQHSCILLHRSCRRSLQACSQELRRSTIVINCQRCVSAVGVECIGHRRACEASDLSQSTLRLPLRIHVRRYLGTCIMCSRLRVYVKHLSKTNDISDIMADLLYWSRQLPTWNMN
jgi:hypothetical protein